MKFFVLAVVLAGVGHAQPPDTFEVASVKLADPMADGWFINFPSAGSLKMEGVTLKAMIQFAYNMRDFQIAGLSGWMTSERYSILAKGVALPGPGNYDQMSDRQRMEAGELVKKRLRKLLAERFQLVSHTETKELPMYALVVARSGVKMQVNTSPDGSKQNIGGGQRSLTGTRASLDFLAQSLAGLTQRPVHNETGLTDLYDLKMEWAPDAPVSPDAPRTESTGPTLLTALQEQLGLKLEPRKGPVEILVVERAERPSEN